MGRPSERRQKFEIVITPKFDRIYRSLRRKQPSLAQDVERCIRRIAERPLAGKPLRHALRNHRRAHVGSLVLLYEVAGTDVRLLDFDHHDKIYEKH